MSNVQSHTAAAAPTITTTSKNIQWKKMKKYTWSEIEDSIDVWMTTFQIRERGGKKHTRFTHSNNGPSTEQWKTIKLWIHHRKKRRTTIIIIRTTHTFLFNFYLYTRSRYACIWTLGIMETHTALLAAAAVTVVATAVLALLFLSIGRVCVCFSEWIEKILLYLLVYTPLTTDISRLTVNRMPQTQTQTQKKRNRETNMNESEWSEKNGNSNNTQTQ